MRVAVASPRLDSPIRGALLLPISVLAVHQLRYYIAFGHRAGAHLQSSGHAYLSQVEPFALLAVALAIGALLGRLAQAWQGHAPGVRSPRPLLRVWLMCALVLLGLYCAQELIEGAFAHGHAAGLGGVIGHGGWIAVPAAAGVGAALALSLRVAEGLVALIAGLRTRRPGAPADDRLLTPATVNWRLIPLSGVGASRAPPRALSPA